MGNHCACLEGDEEHSNRFDALAPQNQLTPNGNGATPGTARVERPPVVLEGAIKYTGQWRGEMREGHGVLERPDGGRYEGQFVANKAQGFGKLSHTNGDVYEGEWFEDKAQGRGKFVH